MLFVLYWSSKNLSCDSWSLGTVFGPVTYLRHSAKVLELSQNFTEYAGLLTLEELLTWEDGVVQASSKSSVLMVLQNDPFEVKDTEEATDKFDVGVDVVDNDVVEGVDAATVWERFNSLPPFPGEFSGDWSIKLPWVFLFFVSRSQHDDDPDFLIINWIEWFPEKWVCLMCASHRFASSSTNKNQSHIEVVKNENQGNFEEVTSALKRKYQFQQ